jgi:GntR family transcriptional regulator, transcriptional repressor for pyruvate dehydrogenase complex
MNRPKARVSSQASKLSASSALARKKPGRKAGQRLAQTLVDEILRRGMTAGSMLPSEPILLEQYAVSRSVLREALRVLEDHGIVMVRPGPGGGPMVVQPRVEDVAQAFRLHLQLQNATYDEVEDGYVLMEPYLARLAAERQDPAGLVAMKAVMEEMDGLDPSDDAAFLDLVSHFFEAIGLMSGNRVVDLLCSVLKEIHDSRVLRDLKTPTSRIPLIIASFREIAEAILEGDGEEAEGLTRAAIIYYVKRVLAKHPDILNEPVHWQDLRAERGKSEIGVGHGTTRSVEKPRD